jgi:hypothetical protein
MHLLLQIQQLPKDRFHPQFLPRLEALSQALGSLGDDDIPQSEHVLGLQLIPTLLALLLPPCPAPPHSVESAPKALEEDPATQTAGVLPADGAAAQRSAAQRSAACSAGLDSCCAVVRQVTAFIMRIALQRQASQSAPWPGDNLILVATEQLVSSPAALRAALQCGLSAETQEAASAGDTAAAECMAAVATMFRVAAFLIQFGACADEGHRSRTEAAFLELAAVLVLEESLPYLELLCLPLDPNSKR